MNTQMKEYRKATLRLAYLLTLMLWTGSCIDMDINRNPYETTQDELMRENHIIGSSLKSMEALVVPTQEHLYQTYEEQWNRFRFQGKVYVARQQGLFLQTYR